MPIEEQLLPSKSLEPYYDKVVWLYVCRTFKEGTLKDKEAHRTHDRFGITSWPQHYLFAPEDARILCGMPRDLKGFVAAMDRVVKGWQPAARAANAARGQELATTLATARATFEKGEQKQAISMVTPLVKQPDRFEAWLEARELLRAWQPGKDRRGPGERLSDPDPRERAIALEELAVGAAEAVPRPRVQELLGREDEDIVVRVRALRCLRRVAPESIAPLAAGLLRVPNDPFRHEVLAVLLEHPDPGLEATLIGLFGGAGSEAYPSRNPNVLRIRAAQCLAVCGGAAAIDVLAQPARECDPRNGLTAIVIRSLAAIGSRAGKTDRSRITAILIDSLPGPCDVAGQERGTAQPMLRRHLHLVGEVLDGIRRVSGNQQMPAVPAVPAAWTSKDREQLRQQLERLFR